MKKPLLLFLLFVVLLLVMKFAYTKYCASKVGGCTEEKFKDNFLTDDHADKD